MIKITWNPTKAVWKGECPRCGTTSFFSQVWVSPFGDGTYLSVAECPDGHPFVVGYKCPTGDTNRREVLYMCPVSGDIGIPAWLPDEYKNAYAEMMYDFKSQKYRSAVALAGIILDAHINTLFKNPGERKKPLAARLEILIRGKAISADQFADATITRLSRNEVVHPEMLATEITEPDAKEAIDAVSSCLERYYRWKTSKALPAPAEQVGEDSASVAATHSV